MSGELSGARDLIAWCAAYGRAALAVSGGADSLALMLLAHREAERLGSHERFIVYSVDHGLRPEAADEVAQVLATARDLGFAARGLKWAGDKPATGIQAAARAARYRLFAAAMAEDGVSDLLTAHHLADQAETVLMRMAHGSGIEGLQGMRDVSFVEGCRVTRPLLDVHPATLRALVREAGLVPIEDPSNADPHYERVRWRQFQPQLDAMGLTIERLGRFAGRAADAASLVSEAAEAAHAELVTPTGAGRMELPHGRFSVLNPLVGKALLEGLLGIVSGDRRPVPLAALEALHGRLRVLGKLRAETLHGCIVSSDGDTLVVRREGPRRIHRAKATSGVTAN